MSDIAKAAGIGRATLYRYFSDVEAILFAWHQRQVAAHLGQLQDLSRGDRPALERLHAVLSSIATTDFEHHGSDLAALLHHGPHIAHAQQRLTATLQGLISHAVDDGDLRNDVPVDELAAFAIHALRAAGTLASREGGRPACHPPHGRDRLISSARVMSLSSSRDDGNRA